MNDGGAPMQGSDWTPEKLPMFRLTTKKVGVNLNVDDRLNRFRLRSNADLTHYDNHEETNAYRTNSLSSGDTYERSMNEAKYLQFLSQYEQHVDVDSWWQKFKMLYDDRPKSQLLSP